MTATPPSSTPAPSPVAPDFDAALWKAVNAAFDEALETDELSRPAFLARLAQGDPRVANEVRRLLGRAHAQTLVTNVVRHPLAGLTTHLAPVLGDSTEKGFDGLLQRALRADRARAKNKRHVGELCGAWRLEEIIGVGGMGEVWLATRADGLYQAKAAVKFLKSDVDSERFEARFAQERSLLARLNHPGIARLIDAGRLFGQPFLVLEYIEGSPLLNYVAERAKTVDARIAIIREIGEAVAYAHSQLVVHRDLKPSNVLVTPSGHAKLLDFGVAGLLEKTEHDETTSSEVTKMAGRGLTVEYAAPELITGEASGVASDIYSIAALAYHLLAGHRAHTPEKPGRAALEHAVLHVVPPRVSEAARARPPQNTKDNIPPPADAVRLEGDIDAIIARALRVDPADRYRSMEAFVSDLRRWAERRPIAARREDRSYRTKLWLRRNWLPVGLTGTLIIALATGMAISVWQYERAQSEATRANKTAEYLVDLLRGADPDVHGGHWPTVLALIEQAKVDLSSKFHDDPAVEQKLSHHVALTLRRLSRFREALPVAQRSLTLSRMLYGNAAESTHRATVLLADVMYWLDDTENALPALEGTLAAPTKNPPPDWWLEGLLLRANMLGELRRFPESYAEFDRYVSFARQQKNAAWLEAEAEADRGLVLGREGRRDEAIALQRKFRAVFENPPPNAKRVALNALSNLASSEILAGDPSNAEATLKQVLSQWDQLAGLNNAHSLSALQDLGFYYSRFDQPQAAIDAYTEQKNRLLKAELPDAVQLLQADLDLLEVRTRYFLSAPSEVRDNATKLLLSIAKALNVTTQKKSRFEMRLAFVLLTVGDVALAEAIGRTHTTEESLAALGTAEKSRHLMLRAYVAAIKGDFVSACNASASASDSWGKQNHDYADASLKTKAALMCTLAGHVRQTRYLEQARQAVPLALAPDHRLRLAVQYVSALQSDRQDIRTEAALSKFSGAVNAKSWRLPAYLPGLIL